MREITQFHFVYCFIKFFAKFVLRNVNRLGFPSNHVGNRFLHSRDGNILQFTQHKSDTVDCWYWLRH